MEITKKNIINDDHIEYVSDKEQEKIEKELENPDCHIIERTEIVEL